MMPTNHAAVHRHIFAVLVENHFGVLGRITGLFSARGFNIESLCVAETEDPTVSRITLVPRVTTKSWSRSTSNSIG